MANQDKPSLLTSKRTRSVSRAADNRTSSDRRAFISDSDRLVLAFGALALAILIQAALDTSSCSFAVARSVLSLVEYVKMAFYLR